MEHNPKTCGCTYLGCDMWSCGNIDNQPEDDESDAPVCERCERPYVWNPAVNAYEHDDDCEEEESEAYDWEPAKPPPCNDPKPSTE